MRRLVLSLFLVSSLSRAAISQSVDPVVHPDRTVSFQLQAPNAIKVSVEGDLGKLSMVRDASGNWTATTAALAPEWYSYGFMVDGQPVIDPHNVTLKASYIQPGNGFLVPGATPAPWETAAIPHGTVHHHTYTTAIVRGLANNQSDFYVYTPPGYDARDAKTKYPVLCLLHGWSDTAAGWTAIGRANDILDAGIAAGTVRPMIVVMPLGYGEMSFVRSGGGVWKERERVDRNVDLFSQALLTEVLPEVSTHYNVSARREDRAIVGLSMGGLESLTIGLKHTDQFAYVGGFSSAVHQLEPAEFTAVGATAAKPKLLWIACGTEDGLIEPNRRLIASLKGVGAPVTAIETPGAHTWLVWRDNLVHFLPLLFR